MKKKILLGTLLASSLLLAACNQTQSSTESSTTDQSSVQSSSADQNSASKAETEKGKVLRYTDGGQIIYKEGEGFAATLMDGTLITYAELEDAYTVKTAEGNMIAKEKDGSYAITIVGQGTVVYNADGTYAVSSFAGNTIETGSGQDNLEKYLTENNYPTKADFESKLKEIQDFIDEKK